MSLFNKASKFAFACVAVFAFNSAMHSQSRAQLADLSCYRLPGGQLDYKKIERDDRQKTLRTNCPTQRATAAQSAQASATRGAPKGAGGAVRPAPAPVSAKFLIRKDLADVGLFSDIPDNSKATGAGISWTRNNVAGDSIWAIDGLAALAISYTPGLESFDSPFIGITLAPYVKVNKQFHTKASLKDADVTTYGSSGEIGFQNPGRGANYFRGRWALTDDNVASSQIGQAAVDWIPTYLRINRQLFGTPIVMSFRPQLTAQYDYVSAGLPPVPFSGKRESLRIGPEAVLWLGYLPSGLEPPAVAAVLEKFYATVTYHWWEETYSSRSGSWLEAAVSFNLDKDGMLALSGSYKRGTDEQSGKDTDLFKVELKVKTCADLPSMGQC